MQGTYLVGAMVVGALFFAEPFTSGKFVGIVGFLLAFALIDQQTWDILSRYIKTSS